MHVSMVVPRHLIYIANARFPTEKAHGIQLAKMVEAFSAAGVALTLILPRLGSAEDPFIYYGIARGSGSVTITHVWTTSSRATAFGFFVSGFIFGITSALAAVRLRGVIYSIDLDNFSFFAVPLLRRPYFFEIHSAKKNTFWYRWLFSRITGVIAINSNVEEALVKTFPILRNKSMVCPNGVDLRLYTQGVKREIKHPAVVYTGSFQAWKGMGTVVEAAKRLPDVHFYLVGGVENLPNLPDNVELLPPQPFKEMPSWQMAADVLLLTGTKTDEYSYRYTSPMKLYEYMAAGRPIVAARTPAITQAASEKEVFFYEPDNAESLADAIKTALSDTNTAGAKVVAARARAAEYTWDKRAARIAAFVDTQLTQFTQ